MAVCEVVFSQSLAGKSTQMRFHFIDLSIFPGTPGVAPDLAAAFESQVVPLINALQSDTISNVSVYARDIGNPGESTTVSSSGTGDVTATAAFTLPPDLPIYLTTLVGAWQDTFSGATYGGVRPGKKGRKFFPGLTEDWVTDDVADVPTTLEAAYAALENKLRDGIPTTTPAANWRYCVYSPAKEAIGSKPARTNDLFAYMTFMTVGRGTRLLSRRP